mmetsp:Transcript_2753/g.7523  ORF Transcript_2753/g.7523 Transcript_2753/m.7523 type:complete len:329 (+) Transcript_2753:309-1295(+)
MTSQSTSSFSRPALSSALSITTGTVLTANLNTSCPFIVISPKRPAAFVAGRPPSGAAVVASSPSPVTYTLYGLTRCMFLDPSLFMSYPRTLHPSSLGAAVSTAAPAPSPNRTHTVRSRQSVCLLSASAPTTSTVLYAPLRMKLVAVARLTTNPLHAAVMSNATALLAPIAPWRRHAPPNRSSGVDVAKRMRSTSSGVTPAISIASREASAASCVTVSPPLSTRRAPIPVRVLIHSSFVSTYCERSSLESESAGAAAPHPAKRTPAAYLCAFSLFAVFVAADAADDDDDDNAACAADAVVVWYLEGTDPGCVLYRRTDDESKHRDAHVC